MTLRKRTNTSSFLAIFLLFTCIAKGQVTKESALFVALKTQDSLFFERSFNQCDFEYLNRAIHKDLVFYHDQGGVQHREAFLESQRNNICSNPDKKPIRKVEENSLEVFPLYDNDVLYGVIQNGIHNFYIREPNKEDLHTNRAKFTHLYLLEDEKWLLKEVLSFDHKEPHTIARSLSFEEEIEALLVQEKVPALGFGIIEDGLLSTIQVFGHLKEGRPAPYNSIFKVASLAKPIIALLTLNLISSGQLDLDEPLYKYWIDPDLKDDERYKKLTPRIILSHQTGFPNWRYLVKSKKLAFEFDPGSAFQYSGEGFEYLRKSLEAKFGKNIEELCDSLIFKPAKMHDTRFWWDSSMDEERYAENHDITGEQLETYKYYEANAAANLLTTVEDYGNFIAYVLNGGGLSEMVFNEMTKNQIQLKENDYFGLGWQKITNFSTGDYALLHSGKDGGVSTLAVLFPETKKGYVIFLNGDNVDMIYERLLSNHLYLGGELWDNR